MCENALTRRGVAVLAALVLALGPWPAAPHLVAYAQAPGVAKIRVEITDSGFKGVAGNFSTEGGGFTIAVEPEQEVELTFVWAHQTYVDDAHVFVLKGYGLETSEITSSNREATLKFVAKKAGTFDLKCDVHCEIHERLVGSLKVAPGVGGPATAMATSATAMSVSVPSSVKVGQRVLLQARLVDSVGAPLANAKVFFTVPASFLSASSDVVVASATTNPEGLAVAEYEPRTGGPLAIQAEFRGRMPHAAARAGAEIAVAEAPGPLYVQHAGVRIPGLNAPPALGPTMVGLGESYGPLTALSGLWPAASAWPIALALLVVWSLYASVVVRTFRIAAAGAATVADRRPAPAGALPHPASGHGLRNFVFPLVAAVVVASFSTLLLTVIARSPYTHANLQALPDPRYTRSVQVVVGRAALPYGGGDLAIPEWKISGMEARAQALLAARGCASCHGLEGQGGAVGPAIAGFKLEELRAKTAEGPGGMPAYPREELSDQELATIAAYLRR